MPEAGGAAVSPLLRKTAFSSVDDDWRFSMRLVRMAVMGPLVFALALSTSAFAQERHAVAPDALAAAVSQHATQQDADRAAIHEALARPEVRQMAETAGVDLARVDKSVDTLTSDSLSRAAAAARDTNQALVGGASTVVISTTTIIVALLVVLLIVLAVD
jgi:pyruvate/2-oxoglutarate dehydrogenase complex dihydrolipoamide acyltransferase (E2) component